MVAIPNMNWMGNEPTGSAYDVYRYYMGGGNPDANTSGSGSGGGITSLPLPLYPPTGGGGGDYQGGGKFGNLDLSKTKTFTKDVWSDTAGPPGQFGWTPTEVKGYYNPTTGHYQTFAGKNINHLGLNVKPAFAGIMEALGFGDKINLDDYGGFKPGQIKGTFTEGWDKGLENIKEGTEEWFEAVKNKIGWSKTKAKKALAQKKHLDALALKEKEKEERKKQQRIDAERAAGAEANRITQRREGKGGSHMSRSVSQGGLGISAAQAQSISDANREAGMGGWGLAEGGMIDPDLSKDPEYLGWKKVYKMNPELGSMHEKHPTFIKFYKKHERDQKKFGGLAGLLYG
jgi:hypothetical protein